MQLHLQLFAASAILLFSNRNESNASAFLPLAVRWPILLLLHLLVITYSCGGTLNDGITYSVLISQWEGTQSSIVIPITPETEVNVVQEPNVRLRTKLPGSLYTDASINNSAETKDDHHQQPHRAIASSFE